MNPPAYGGSVLVYADVYIRDHYATTVEAYAVSYENSANLQGVALPAKPKYRPDGTLDNTCDPVGPLLDRTSSNPVEAEFARALTAEAHKANNVQALRDDFEQHWKERTGEGARADHEYERRMG